MTSQQDTCLAPALVHSTILLRQNDPDHPRAHTVWREFFLAAATHVHDFVNTIASAAAATTSAGTPPATDVPIHNWNEHTAADVAHAFLYVGLAASGCILAAPRQDDAAAGIAADVVVDDDTSNPRAAAEHGSSTVAAHAGRLRRWAASFGMTVASNVPVAAAPTPAPAAPAAPPLDASDAAAAPAAAAVAQPAPRVAILSLSTRRSQRYTFKYSCSWKAAEAEGVLAPGTDAFTCKYLMASAFKLCSALYFMDANYCRLLLATTGIFGTFPIGMDAACSTTDSISCEPAIVAAVASALGTLVVNLDATLLAAVVSLGRLHAEACSTLPLPPPFFLMRLSHPTGWQQKGSDNMTVSTDVVDATGECFLDVLPSSGATPAVSGTQQTSTSATQSSGSGETEADFFPFKVLGAAVAYSKGRSGGQAGESRIQGLGLRVRFLDEVVSGGGLVGSGAANNTIVWKSTSFYGCIRLTGYGVPSRAASSSNGDEGVSIRLLSGANGAASTAPSTVDDAGATVGEERHLHSNCLAARARFATSAAAAEATLGPTPLRGSVKPISAEQLYSGGIFDETLCIRYVTFCAQRLLAHATEIEAQAHASHGDADGSHHSSPFPRLLRGVVCRLSLWAAAACGTFLPAATAATAPFASFIGPASGVSDLPAADGASAASNAGGADSAVAAVPSTLLLASSDCIHAAEVLRREISSIDDATPASLATQRAALAVAEPAKPATSNTGVRSGVSEAPTPGKESHQGESRGATVAATSTPSTAALFPTDVSSGPQPTAESQYLNPADVAARADGGAGGTSSGGGGTRLAPFAPAAWALGTATHLTAAVALEAAFDEASTVEALHALAVAVQQADGSPDGPAAAGVGCSGAYAHARTSIVCAESPLGLDPSYFPDELCGVALPSQLAATVAPFLRPTVTPRGAPSWPRGVSGSAPPLLLATAHKRATRYSEGAAIAISLILGEARSRAMRALAAFGSVPNLSPSAFPEVADHGSGGGASTGGATAAVMSPRERAIFIEDAARFAQRLSSTVTRHTALRRALPGVLLDVIRSLATAAAAVTTPVAPASGAYGTHARTARSAVGEPATVATTTTAAGQKRRVRLGTGGLATLDAAAVPGGIALGSSRQTHALRRPRSDDHTSAARCSACAAAVERIEALEASTASWDRNAAMLRLLVVLTASALELAV